jgi:hypothetical protein
MITVTAVCVYAATLVVVPRRRADPASTNPVPW